MVNLECKCQTGRTGSRKSLLFYDLSDPSERGYDLVEVVQRNWEAIWPACVAISDYCLKFEIFPRVRKTGKVKLKVVSNTGERDPSDTKSNRPIKLLPGIDKAFYNSD